MAAVAFNVLEFLLPQVTPALAAASPSAGNTWKPGELGYVQLSNANVSQNVSTSSEKAPCAASASAEASRSAAAVHLPTSAMTLALIVVPGVFFFGCCFFVVVDGDDVLDLVAKQSVAECGIVNIV